MRQILLFGCEDALAGQIRRALALVQITVKQIARQDYGRTLHSLVTGQGQGLPYGGQELPRPVLVFVDFTNEELDRVLALLRSTELAADALKAVMTQTNQNWNIIVLLAHLEEEHRQMTKAKESE